MASTRPEFWADYKFHSLISFSVDNSGLVFSSRWPEPKPVTSINDENLDLQQPDTEYVIVLTYDENGTVTTSEATVRRICSSWSLPAASAKALFTRGGIYGLRSEPINTLSCVWYQLVIPVVSSNKVSTGKKLQICHVLNNDTRTARTLVISPKALEATVLQELKTHVTENGRAKGTLLWPGWFTAHLVLAALVERRAAIEHFTRLRATAATAHGQASRSIDGALDAECLKNCNKVLESIEHFEAEMEHDKHVLQYLKLYPADLRNDQFLGSQTVSHGMQNVINDIGTIIQSLEFFKHSILSVRHTLLHAMEIRNATYMRQNTIALRRLATQSRIESEHMKKQSELSAKNTVIATRIAVLTMLYLPPTFIAAVFSTPFLQLDDSLQFKAVTKIWVYIVSSLVFTLITLISYIYWFPAGTHDGVFSSNNDSDSKLGGQSSSAEDIKLQDLDDALLEPTPFVPPAMEDLESALKKIISSRFPVNRGGSTTDRKADATLDTPRNLTGGADLLE